MSSLRSNHYPWRLAVASLALVLGAGLLACSGGSEASTASTSFSTIAATTTTRSATTTSTTVAKSTTTVEETTTTAPPPPVYPLTGLLVGDPVIAARPALVVKIDNASPARPQTGFNSADVVFEEIVNDNLTRFAMVFQSGDSDPVGPIRSGRIQDIDLFSALNHPLFAWSGGNATVTEAIRASDLVEIGPNRASPGTYFRSGDRKAPHNLYSSTGALWSNTPFGAGPPAQQFGYRSADEAPAGAPSTGVAMVLDSVDVRWDWDPASGMYFRTMENRPHFDAGTDTVVSTSNVVVLVTEYLPGISGSPDAQTIGTGEAMVFTGGTYIHGVWTRTDARQPFTLVADDGEAIELTPGRTFVELPRPASTIPIPA